jgi:hypothetical protein
LPPACEAGALPFELETLVDFILGSKVISNEFSFVWKLSVLLNVFVVKPFVLCNLEVSSSVSF